MTHVAIRSRRDGSGIASIFTLEVGNLLPSSVLGTGGKVRAIASKWEMVK
jgi:hypothetical protein